MKILAVGRNYVEHIKELENEKPDEPVIFSKPDTALIKNNGSFYYPSFSKDVHHEVEIVIKISKEGKNIDPKFSNKYYEEIGVGIDFTARDIQSKLKEKGLPWELAKAFDGSAPISDFMSKTELGDIQNIDFSLLVNGEPKQKGNTSLMLFKIDYLISFISKFITLKKGDLIFTGTPKGVSAVKIGDKLEAFIGSQKLLEVEVK